MQLQLSGDSGTTQVEERMTDQRSEEKPKLGTQPQKFFHDLYVAARSPGYGDQHRAFVANLLLRAQEAGLYTPEAA